MGERRNGSDKYHTVYKDVEEEVCKDIDTKSCPRVWKDDNNGGKVWVDNPEYSPDYSDIHQHGKVGLRASGLLASEIENCKWHQKGKCRQVHKGAEAGDISGLSVGNIPGLS